MRGLGAALMILTAVLLAATPAQAAKRRAAPCSSKGSKTVINTRDVRVYKERDEVGRAVGLNQIAYYGCLKSKNDAVLLGTSDAGDGLNGSNFLGVKIAGRFAVVDNVIDTGCARVFLCPEDNPDGIVSEVTSTDLRRPKSERKLRLLDPPAAYAVTQRGGLVALSKGVLTAVDAAGTRQLDAGAIDGRTLRAEISIVSWVRDGVERFARLR